MNVKLRISPTQECVVNEGKPIWQTPETELTDPCLRPREDDNPSTHTNHRKQTTLPDKTLAEDCLTGRAINLAAFRKKPLFWKRRWRVSMRKGEEPLETCERGGDEVVMRLAEQRGPLRQHSRMVHKHPQK
ncbi:hypothetical protein E2C01_048557 [Portunus trituberculatus]|uniref:Uncharacterized protein n=1 Tax=Portunus trituberculatus TaxID=210409 RepID=A0A5B7GBD5_PORTR|nr:hypothetical protein [Portunus trituberculatus]